MDYEAVSDRIVMARWKGQSNSLTILSVYAPIRDTPDQLKDKFYADLQLTLNKIPRKDILAISGDFNWHETKQFWMGHWQPVLVTDVLTELDFSYLLCWIVSVWLIHVLNTNLPHLHLQIPRWSNPCPNWLFTRFSSLEANDRRLESILRGGHWIKKWILPFFTKSKVRFRLSSKKISAPRRILDIEKLKLPEIKETFMLELTNRFTALQDNDR